MKGLGFEGDDLKREMKKERAEFHTVKAVGEWQMDIISEQLHPTSY